MSRWSTVALAGALLSTVIAGGPTRAFAFDFQISNPASGGNLSVYFVDGNGPIGPGGSSIMTLDQAVAQGAVKVYQQRPNWSTDAAGHKIQVNGPVALENLSGQSIFMQLGGFVAGGHEEEDGGGEDEGVERAAGVLFRHVPNRWLRALALSG